MIPVYEMSWINYNANSKDNSKPDCSLRALSLAYDLPYDDVSKEQRGKARSKGFSYNDVTNINSFINDHGYTPLTYTDLGRAGKIGEIWNPSDVVTVKDFADTHNTGTYLVLTGKKPKGNITAYDRNELRNSNHILCIIDGDVYDSWDSMNQYVRQYCLVDGNPNTTINKDKTDNVTLKQLADEAVNEYKQKYLLNTTDFEILNWDLDDPWVSSEFRVYTDDYTVTVDYTLFTKAQTEIPKDFITKIDGKKHRGRFVIKITPKMTNDQIKEVIDTQVESNIKKLASYFKREQKFADEMSGTSIQDLYPSLTSDLRGEDLTKVLKLLKKADPYIQQNVLDVYYDTYNKEWCVTIKADPDDEYNNEKYMLVKERGKVNFHCKNTNQLNYMYNEYKGDVEGYSTEHSYYESSYW